MEKKLQESMEKEIEDFKNIFLNVFKNRSALDFETPPFDQYSFEKLANYLPPDYKDKISYVKEKIYSLS